MNQPPETQRPPGHLPPAAIPPWPVHPAPHLAAATIGEPAITTRSLVLSLIGGAAAAVAIGAFFLWPSHGAAAPKKKAGRKKRGRSRKR